MLWLKSPVEGSLNKVCMYVKSFIIIIHKEGGGGLFGEVVSQFSTFGEGTSIRPPLFLLKLCLKPVLGRSAYLSQVVLNHVAVSAIGSWFCGGAFFARMPGASTPAALCFGRVVRVACYMLNLFFKR